MRSLTLGHIRDIFPRPTCLQSSSQATSFRSDSPKGSRKDEKLNYLAYLEKLLRRELLEEGFLILPALVEIRFAIIVFVGRPAPRNKSTRSIERRHEPNSIHGPLKANRFHARQFARPARPVFFPAQSQCLSKVDGTRATFLTSS